MSLYSKITNRLVYPLGDRICGTHIVKSLNELREKQWWPPEQIQAEQNDKLARLIEHSYENVPYWRRLFDRSGLKPCDIKTKDDLRKLPVTTKDDIRENLEEMVAGNYPAKKLIEQHSSGSTGEPLKYYTDKDQYSCRIALVFRFWECAGYEFGKKWLRVQLWPHNKLSARFADHLL